MKKVISFFSLILMIFSLVGCNQIGETNDVKVTIEKSENFSKKEIEDSIECVKVNFKSFKGCNLTDLWYDEDKSNHLVDVYLKYGRGSENGATAENTIVLMSNFNVNSSGGDGSLDPNSTYSDFQWVLIRDSKTAKWKVDDCGY